MVDTTSKTGYISQIIGPVVDIEFPSGDLPKIYNAVVIGSGDDSITCEVQQLLGNNKVRAVSMTSTDGLKRGADVVDTGAPITVPTGKATLGRIFNVLGVPVDASVDDIFLPTSPDLPIPQTIICVGELFIVSTAFANSFPSIFSNLSIPSL